AAGQVRQSMQGCARGSAGAGLRGSVDEDHEKESPVADGTTPGQADMSFPKFSVSEASDSEHNPPRLTRPLSPISGACAVPSSLLVDLTGFKAGRAVPAVTARPVLLTQKISISRVRSC